MGLMLEGRDRPMLLAQTTFVTLATIFVVTLAGWLIWTLAT
jgi:hypothetical protein